MSECSRSGSEISRREKAAFALLTLLVFLLPLKFGGVAAMPESAGYFPENISGYLISSWPPAALGIPASLILLLTLSRATSFRRSDWLFGFGFLLAALPGCFSGGEKEVTWQLISYLSASGALALASALLARRIPRAVEILGIAFFSGAILTACNGYYQYFFGFDEMREFAAAQEENAGIILPEAIKLKLADTRINSFLVSSNALAGLLLMALPFAFYFGKKWGSRFSPAKAAVPLFFLVFSAILTGALILSGSRSALVAAAVLAGTALFSLPELSGKAKLAGALAAVLILTAGIFFLWRRGRTFSSMGERADYLHTCAVMCRENPVAGGGWGSFHFRHMALKLSGTDEAARDPHNLIASCAAQSGIPAGVLACWLLFLPLMRLWKFRFAGIRGAVFWSIAAFSLHTLMDSDMLVPSLFVFWGIEAAAAGEGRAEKDRSRFSLPAVAGTALFALLTALQSVYWSYGEFLLSRFQSGIFPQSAEEMRCMPMVPERYRQLCRLRPACAIVPESMGLWYESRRKYPAAEACFAESLRREPRRPSVYRHLARMACRRGDTVQAARYRDEALRRFPKAPKNRERMMKP